MPSATLQDGLHGGCGHDRHRADHLRRRHRPGLQTSFTTAVNEAVHRRLLRLRRRQQHGPLTNEEAAQAAARGSGVERRLDGDPRGKAKVGSDHDLTGGGAEPGERGQHSTGRPAAPRVPGRRKGGGFFTEPTTPGISRSDRTRPVVKTVPRESRADVRLIGTAQEPQGQLAVRPFLDGSLRQVHPAEERSSTSTCPTCVSDTTTARRAQIAKARRVRRPRRCRRATSSDEPHQVDQKIAQDALRPARLSVIVSLVRRSSTRWCCRSTSERANSGCCARWG